LIVSVTVAVCASAPLVPLIVSVRVPRATLRWVVTVSVDVDVWFGLNVPAARAGTSVTLRLTEPPNPLTGFTAIA
jgi:hypothetical protein